jgi:signal peptidase I
MFAWPYLVAFTGILGFVVWLVVRRRTPVQIERLGVMRASGLAVAGLVAPVLTALCLVTFVFQVARVEGRSMEPTLRSQERVFVNKLAYRLGLPHRGDVVMLYYPSNPDQLGARRIIAEAGDVVRIVDGKVQVNDADIDDVVGPEDRGYDGFGPTVVPNGYYFVLSDNRKASSDSRHWGFVPRRYILGRIIRTRR